ncbi:MAG: DUF3575 domain-containing protein [Polaribacter sp.]|nr:DUF3575 domain-containing protein [Polaribacter sp.]MDB4202575.1 DUF3575 domain-containing protein [Polaribacter sp.]MDC1462483.1 DUF3575 domain-containing protein [Polaribacter sp.]
MKKYTLFICLFVSGIALGQEPITEKTPEFPQDINKKHEVKINGLSLLAFEWLDVSYEYLINEESSFGVTALVALNDSEALNYYRKSSLTSFYRRYFSNQYARGFFVEGFGMLHTYENETYDYNGNGSYKQEDQTDFAVGISAGGKFITKRGFTAEIYLGIGRNLGGDNSSIEAVGRGGILLGFRF